MVREAVSAHQGFKDCDVRVYTKGSRDQRDAIEWTEPST